MDRRRKGLDTQTSFDSSLLKEHIKSRLRQFVDTSLDVRSLAATENDMASQKRDILDRLRSSDGFRRWKTEVLRSEIDLLTASATSSRNLSRAVTENQTALYSIEDFGGDFSLDSQNEDDDGEDSQPHLNSGLSFTLTGTMSATAFAFMGRNYLRHVVEILVAPLSNSDEDSNVVCDTIQALTQLPASDICESEHWSDFKTALRQLLVNSSANQQRRLSDAVLGFLVKLFNASSHNVTVDAFTLLADHLREDVFGSKCIIYRVKDGRQLELDNGGCFVMQKLRVLDEMCLGFARVLARYSQQHLSDVAEKLMALLEPDSTVATKENVFTSFLAWSLLDPNMKWWRHWMHGRLGRLAILSALEKHCSVAEFLLKVALESEHDDEKDSILRTVGILKMAVASRMAEGLLAYRESRSLLAKYLTNFPEDQVDRLLKNAMEDGQRSSKLAWKIIFILASNPYGRGLFLEERRLRRIGMELLNKSHTYQTKIKLLNFISELLKSYDPSTENVSKIFYSPIEYRDGTATFCQLVMNAISDFIEAAHSRDPDVPLSLVFACFDTCTILCRSHSGRRLVSGYEEFLLYAVRLVKEHSVEANTLLPILASVSLEDETSDFVLKKFLGSHAVTDARFYNQRGPAILWHRPMDVNDSTIQTVTNGLKDMETVISRLNDDPDAIERAIRPHFRHLFLILCHPEGSNLLLRNANFMKTILQPFDDFQETPYMEFLIRILDLALHRADFLVGIRENCDLALKIDDLLTKQYSWEQETEADSPKFWIQNAFSTKLVDIYLRLGHLGGPNERIMAESDLTSLSGILSGSTNYFCSEPSRFLVRPVTTGAISLREGSEIDVKAFIGFVERKKRVQYSEMLLEAVKGFPGGHFEGDTLEGTVQSGIYDRVLEYGKNLGIVEPEGTSVAFPSFIRTIHKLTGTMDTENQVDWFAAVVYLIFGGRHQKVQEFLHRFSQTDSATLKCAWPRMSSGSEFAGVLVKEMAYLMDEILENELPRVLAALTMHGITTSNLLLFWLNQSFINVLDWPEICNYTTLTVLGGIRYQAFFCCCVCHQMYEEICDRAHYQKDDRDLHSFLIGPISFKLHKSVPFLSFLSDKYM